MVGGWLSRRCRPPKPFPVLTAPCAFCGFHASKFASISTRPTIDLQLTAAPANYSLKLRRILLIISTHFLPFSTLYRIFSPVYSIRRDDNLGDNCATRDCLQLLHDGATKLDYKYCDEPSKALWIAFVNLKLTRVFNSLPSLKAILQSLSAGLVFAGNLKGHKVRNELMSFHSCRDIDLCSLFPPDSCFRLVGELTIHTNDSISCILWIRTT